MKADSIKNMMDENRKFFSSLSFEDLESMLLKMAKHMFSLDEVKNHDFTLTKCNNMFKSAYVRIYDYNTPYRSIEICVNNLNIQINRQNGHLEFEKVSAFPSEFLYMFINKNLNKK